MHVVFVCIVCMYVLYVCVYVCTLPFGFTSHIPFVVQLIAIFPLFFLADVCSPLSSLAVTLQAISSCALRLSLLHGSFTFLSHGTSRDVSLSLFPALISLFPLRRRRAAARVRSLQ